MKSAQVPAIDVTGKPLAELLRLDGRLAVVTGGAKGLGEAIAGRLAEAGAHVVIVDADAEAAAAAARNLSSTHGESVVAATLDVRDAAAVAALADDAVGRFGDLRIWVNNAGIFPPADPIDATTTEFEEIMQVNVTGVHHGCQTAARHMIRSASGGVIVNLSSTGGYRGAGAYSASKWAVRGITQGLAARLGRHGIRVVGVAPTLVVTPGTTGARERGGRRLEAFMEDLVDSLPLGRVGVPDDVARVVAFLASDAAAFVTGVTVPVDGGELSV